LGVPVIRREAAGLASSKTRLTLAVAQSSAAPAHQSRAISERIALGIIGEYLHPSQFIKLVESYGLRLDDIAEKQRKSISSADGAPLSADADTTSDPLKRKTPASSTSSKSAAAKKLAKSASNTKSIASFFKKG